MRLLGVANPFQSVQIDDPSTAKRGRKPLVSRAARAEAKILRVRKDSRVFVCLAIAKAGVARIANRAFPDSPGNRLAFLKPSHCVIKREDYEEGLDYD
jgi:hypothetical protein